jgi:Activator of 2-hydroxyglutaryl-CoA dehydratase (HSP70-class ATPase domain)
MKLGIDVGSTTVKLVLIDENNKLLYKRYERHMSNVLDKAAELMRDLYSEYGDIEVNAVITGSGGLSLSRLIGVYFEQEVIS